MGSSAGASGASPLSGTPPAGPGVRSPAADRSAPLDQSGKELPHRPTNPVIVGGGPVTRVSSGGMGCSPGSPWPVRECGYRCRRRRCLWSYGEFTRIQDHRMPARIPSAGQRAGGPVDRRPVTDPQQQVGGVPSPIRPGRHARGPVPDRVTDRRRCLWLQRVFARLSRIQLCVDREERRGQYSGGLVVVHASFYEVAGRFRVRPSAGCCTEIAALWSTAMECRGTKRWNHG